LKIIPIILSIPLLLTVTGCGYQPAAATLTATATHLSATALPTETLEPSPTGTALPTETPQPSLTPPPLPTAIPDSWRTYTNPALNVTFRYPDGWQAETPTRYSGPDGFFDLSARTYPASVFDSLSTLCVLEANRARPSIYGTLPMTGGWQEQGVGDRCAVIPVDENPAGEQAVLFARYPLPAPPEQVLVLRTDAAHYGGIVSTLRFIDSITPTPSTPGYYNSPACGVEPPGPPVTVSHFAGLTITEYAIAIAACDPWLYLDGFRLRMGGLTQKMNDIYSSGLAVQIAEANRLLAPFNYRLVGSPAGDAPVGFDVYHGEKLLASRSDRLGPVSVNAAGDDFVFWIQDMMTNHPPVEVRRDSLRALTVWDHGFNTVWAGTGLISYADAGQLYVQSNSQQIYSMAIPPFSPAGWPVRGLWSWQGHWLLEVANVVVQDGELQNLKLGYDEMFEWHLVHGSPFYFFSRGGAYGLAYAGQELSQRYDDVIHGQLCCDPAFYSIRSSAAGAWFFALKDGVWRLVSVLA
jgi:hypothetical protein